VICVNNQEGTDSEDDDGAEWFLPDLGVDVEYFGYEKLFLRFRDGLGFAYAGGWADQLWQHVEIIELYMALDKAIKR